MGGKLEGMVEGRRVSNGEVWENERKVSRRRNLDRCSMLS